MTDYSAFPRIEGLVDLACRKGIDVRPTLLRVLTDLYVQTRSHTPSEEAQYVALALPLIDSTDDATRTIVAERLAAYPRAPLTVVRRLNELAQPLAAALAPTPALKSEAEDLGLAFFDATNYERQMMLTNLEPGQAEARPQPAAVETCRRLEAAVLEHRPDEFIRILQSTLMLPRSI